MKALNPFQERRRHLAKAQAALVKAASLLSDELFLGEPEAQAAAVVWTGIALLMLRKADASGSVGKQAVEMVKQLREVAR